MVCDVVKLGHERQAVAALVSEYVPAWQSAHNALPGDGLCEPGLQGVHGPVPVNPASHWHAAELDDPDGDKLFAGHGWQILLLS